VLSNPDIKYHFMLVHGTFSPDAPWTQDQSALCSAILKALGAVAFSRFNWTGKNSHKARITAGLELAAFVRSASEAYPHASLFIIAHSHGGNVALYGHRFLGREFQSPSNIITLATPFIRSKVRNVSLLIRIGWFIFLTVLSFFVFGGYLSHLVNPFLDADSPLCAASGWDDRSCGPALLLMLAQLVVTITIVHLLIRAYAKKQSRAWLGRLVWPEEGSIHLLTVSYRWDEARIYLRALDWVTRLVSRGIWHVIGLAALCTALYVALTVYAAIFHQVLYTSSFITTSGGWPHAITIAFFSFGGGIVLLTFIGGLALLLNLLRGNPFGFGWERPSSSFLVDIQTLDVPSGLRTQSQEHYRIPVGAFAKANRGLAHSLIYEDPRIHEKIINWTTSRRIAEAEERRIAQAKRRAEPEAQRQSPPPKSLSWRAVFAAGWLIVMVVPPVGAWIARPSSPGGPGVVSALTSEHERALKPKDTFKECTNCPSMTVVPAGSFMMASSASKRGRYSTRHRVTIAAPFAVGQFEVTFDEWDACVADRGCNGYKPRDLGWGRGRRPVIHVSWEEAKAYVAWLVKTTGKPYRLLSEAEHEYATRAGTTTTFPWGNTVGTNNANCNGCNSQWVKRTAPVGSFTANQFGLYDMVGNVWEWTEDCDNYWDDVVPSDGSAWTDGRCSSRVLRGGAWNGPPDHVVSVSRASSSQLSHERVTGFRVSRTLLLAPTRFDPTNAP
jgi:formylglycine-generating enzyme required for sulfatase activity